MGKININNQVTFKEHRSGWSYAINALLPLHNSDGVLFDGFLENTFCWSKFHKIQNNIIPYNKKWVGFIHNPQCMPFWFDAINSPQVMLASKEFRESLDYCAGLYCLSEYFKGWLEDQIPWIKVNSLYHPTETPDVRFDINKYINKEKKQIVQLGWWLRKLDSIYRLPVNKNFKKIRLFGGNPRIKLLEDRERSINRKIGSKYPIVGTTHVVGHLSNQAYDNMLSDSIAFIDIYDSSANNAVIECIVRNTPVAVTKHSAVIEYLGADYPLYFEDLGEAAEKISNVDLVSSAHNYLVNLNKDYLSSEYFFKSFCDSSIYRAL